MSFFPLPSPPPSQTSSPALSIAMLKSRLTPDNDDACMPTSQVFDSHIFDVDLDDDLHSSSSIEDIPQPSLSIHRRESSPDEPAAKKHRPTTKEFIPPDVSGLSKREARLVKNRAAAFLSRQRKREEFENMEIRVAQLEEENAKLVLSLSNSASEPDSFLRSEIESLRSQLAASQAREQDLLAIHSPNPVKLEPEDPPLLLCDLSPKESVSLLNSSSPNKSAASFGLMVLLCALPSLLSVPNSPMPTSFAIPPSISASSSSCDFSSFLPNDFDWARPISHPSFDIDSHSSSPSYTPSPTAGSPSTHRLEFADMHTSPGLADLDVSFDTCSTPDGKIRVKIHRPVSSVASSPASWAPSLSQLSPETTDHPASMSPSPDPFFGVPTSRDSPAPSPADINYDINYDLGSDYTIATQLGVRKRVRIALKSLPASGGEGGEWEVELR